MITGADMEYLDSNYDGVLDAYDGLELTDLG
jgi:hypothetical protein